MAYVKNNDRLNIGDHVITTRVIESCGGYFEKGSKVRIIGISERGYDLADYDGNRIIDTGFDSVKRE